MNRNASRNRHLGGVFDCGCCCQDCEDCTPPIRKEHRTSKGKTRDVVYRDKRGRLNKVKVNYDGPCDPTVIHGFDVNPTSIQDIIVTGLISQTMYVRGPDSGMGLFDFLTGLIYSLTGGFSDFSWRIAGQNVETVSAVIHPSQFAFGIVNVHFTTPIQSPVAYGLTFDAYTFQQYSKLCWDEVRYALNDCGGLIEAVIPQCIDLVLTGTIDYTWNSFYLPLVDQPEDQVIYANVPEPDHPASTTPADAPSPPQETKVSGKWVEKPITYILWDGLNRNDKFSIIPLQPMPGYSRNPVTGPSLNLDMRVDRWIRDHPQFAGPTPNLGDIKYGLPEEAGKIPCTLMTIGPNGWYSYASPPSQPIQFYKIQVYEWVASD
jgi:hypothetical protein